MVVSNIICIFVYQSKGNIMNKYLVTIEFRYLDAPKGDHDSSSKSKTITIGVFDDVDVAHTEGNKALEVLESKFPLNSNYNTKERFSKNGGCFGTPNHLISDLAYLRTPFSFFAKVTTLNILDVNDTITEVLEAGKRYKAYKAEIDND